MTILALVNESVSTLEAVPPSHCSHPSSSYEHDRGLTSKTMWLPARSILLVPHQDRVVFKVDLEWQFDT